MVGLSSIFSHLISIYFVFNSFVACWWDCVCLCICRFCRFDLILCTSVSRKTKFLGLRCNKWRRCWCDSYNDIAHLEFSIYLYSKWCSFLFQVYDKARRFSCSDIALERKNSFNFFSTYTAATCALCVADHHLHFSLKLCT